MDTTTGARADNDAFACARRCFEKMLSWLEGAEAASLSHAELEEQVTRRGREAQRLSLQDHFDLRAIRERRVEAVDAEGIVHPNVEPGHSRQLSTVVGTVAVERFAHRREGTSNLHPADAALNLPERLHSHGLRRLAAIESTRGSFDDASAAIARATGVSVAKRQVESLATAAAVDVEEYYATRAAKPASEEDALVISVDGKGIVMRPDALRAATAKAASKAKAKLATRVSKGEKRNRKRMAELGAVYDITPVVRTVSIIVPTSAGSCVSVVSRQGWRSCRGASDSPIAAVGSARPPGLLHGAAAPLVTVASAPLTPAVAAGPRRRLVVVMDNAQDDEFRHSGEYLRSLRERARMTVEEVAERAGVDPSWLSDVERNGTHDLLYSDICNLVRATQPPRPEWWDDGYEHDLNLGPNAVVGPLTPSQQEYWARIEAVRAEIRRHYGGGERAFA